MATKAYLMIHVAEKFSQDDFQKILIDLENIPEVIAIEQVKGACELLVKVDVPLSRMNFVVNTLMTKEWVKHLRTLHVVPIQPDKYQGLNVDALIWLKRVIPAEMA